MSEPTPPPPLLAPHSTAEFIYHLAVVLLIGLGVILSAVSVLQHATEPAPTVEWVPVGDGCYQLTGPILVHSCPDVTDYQLPTR